MFFLAGSKEVWENLCPASTVLAVYACTKGILTATGSNLLSTTKKCHGGDLPNAMKNPVVMQDAVVRAAARETKIAS